MPHSTVLKRLEEQKLVAEMSESGFFATKAQFCGHVQQAGRQTSAKGKMMVIEGLPKPKEMEELYGFLGLCNFSSQYVPKYVGLATLLMELFQPKHLNTAAQQRTSMMKIQWNGPAEEAFIRLKKAFYEHVPLKLINYAKPFGIEVDACKTAIGGELFQDDDQHCRRPVEDISRKLTASQVNWPTREKEAYAIVAALEEW